MFSTYSHAHIFDDSNLPNNTSMPLWSTRGMLSEDRLQYQITREVPLEKSTDEVLNMNTYICYICDTTVPKAHMKCHNEGEKHKICLKIADIALERARKQMMLDIKESSVTVSVMDTYFCEPCSIIIQTKNKTVHEETSEHRKSVNYVELLKDFYVVYADREEAVATLYDNYDIYDNFEEFKEEFYSQIDETDKADNFKQTNVSNANNNNVLLDSEIKGQESIILENKESNVHDECKNESNVTNKRVIDNQNDRTKLDVSNESKNKQTNLKVTVQVSEQNNKVKKNNDKLKAYTKTLTESYSNTHSVEAMTDKLLLITATNGDKIKVSLNNFHSVHEQNGRSYCKVCQDTNIGEGHFENEAHIDNIMVPIEDLNGIRKVDDVWSHCILCNDLIRNLDFHLKTILHRKKLTQAAITAGLDLNQNVIHAHDNHTTKLIQEHSLIVSHNRSDITCNICNVTISNHLMSIKDHISTFDHITAYNATVEHNKLCEISAAEFYCVPCDMLVAKCYALGHCNGKKHNKHLNEMLKNEDVSQEAIVLSLPSINQEITRNRPKNPKSNSELICFVCNIVISNINDHMNSLEHKKKHFSYLEANKLNEIDDDTFFCIPCNTVIMIDYLMGHCNAKKHKNLVKKFREGVPNAPIDSDQILTENSHISRSITENKQKKQNNANDKQIISQNGVYDTAIPLKYLYQFTEIGKSMLLCTICDEEVFYRKQDVQHHVTQIEHVVSFNIMMLWNKIKRQNDKYFCDFCHVDVTYFNELNHVNSTSHLEALQRDTKVTVYEYDRRLLTMEFAMSHKIGDRVRPSSLIVSKSKN